MRQKSLHIKAILILCLLGLGTHFVGINAETTATITFGSGTGALNVNDASVSGDDDQGNEWTVTTVGTTSFTQNPGYSQIGSSKKPATSITFTTTLANNVKVTSFSASFGGFTDTAGDINLKVNETTVGTGSLNAATDVTVSSTQEAEGNILTVTVTGISKGVKAYSISYTYEEMPAYTITAQSNNDNYGTVSLSGTTITAVPNNGYRVVAGDGGYTVTSGTATVTNNGDNTFTVDPKTECKVTINFEAIPSHTLAYEVSPAAAGTVELSATSVREGSTATATAAANAGYKFTGWSISGEGAEISGAEANPVTVTMGTADATLTANFEAVTTYAISWSVNDVVTTENVEENTAINFQDAAVPAGCSKVFVGWANSTVAETDEAPDFVTSATATQDITYYAVFANKVGDTTNTKDLLTRETTGVSDGATTYSSWSGKTVTTTAVYAGNSAGSNNAIQLRSTSSTGGSYSGIVSTTSGGKITKVTVTWNASTSAGRKLEVWGKNSSYESANDLYDPNKRGTKLGTIDYGTSTELTITGDYEYVGVRSASGAMYLDNITFTWQSGDVTYSGYTTTVGQSVRVGSALAATYVTAENVSFPMGVSAYIATKATEESVTLKEVVAAPAGTPLIVMATTAGTYDLEIEAAEDCDDVSTNLLAVSDGDDGVNDYVLYNGDEGAGFYKWTGAALAAGRVYLPAESVPAAAAALKIVFADETTAIATVEQATAADSPCYNLSGQRVGKTAKGLYIKDGRKYIVK